MALKPPTNKGTRYRYLLNSGYEISLPKFIWKHLDKGRRRLVVSRWY